MAGGFDHAQRLPERAFRPEGVVDEDRQHLNVHPACAELGEPPLAEVRRLPGSRSPRDEHEQVVVGVGDNRVAVQCSSIDRAGHADKRDTAATERRMCIGTKPADTLVMPAPCGGRRRERRLRW